MLRDSVRLSVNLPLFVLVLLLISSIADLAVAKQVDRRVPLEEISTDFEMEEMSFIPVLRIIGFPNEAMCSIKG